MASPRTDFQSWIDACCSHPVHLKNIFRKFCSSYKCKHCLISCDSIPSPDAPVPADAPPAAVFSCEICNFTCFSLQQLASHRFDVHEYVKPVRLRIVSPTCLKCGTNFHTRRRLFRHLSRRPTKNICASAYESVCPMTRAELKEPDEAEPVSDKRAFLPPPVKSV